MNIVNFSTRRPVTVIVFAVAAIIFGLVAFRDLAVDLLPDITYPSLTVRTELEGAAPAEIETLITRPVENAVGVVNGVVRVTSSSRADLSEVTLEFGWGTNMDFAALDVRERLDLLQLPDDADRPILLRYDPSLDPVMRIGLTGEEELVRLRLIGDEQVKRLLERVEGVAAAIVTGGLEEEIQVEIDERRVASLGLTVEEVVARLAAGERQPHRRTPSGGPGRVPGPHDQGDRAGPRTSTRSSWTPAARASSGSRTSPAIVKGHKEREVITRIDGQEAVEVAIYKEGGTNTVTVVDAGHRSAGLGPRAARDHRPPAGADRHHRPGPLHPPVGRRGAADAPSSAASLAILVLFLFLRELEDHR